jgi:hypothetical protein
LQVYAEEISFTNAGKHFSVPTGKTNPEELTVVNGL